MIDGGSVGVAVLLIDGGKTVRRYAIVVRVSLVDGGDVMVTVLLVDSGTVGDRLTVVTPPRVALGNGRVVVVAVLLFNVGLTVISSASVDALLDVGLVIVAALLANGFGIAVPVVLCDSGCIAAGTGLVDVQFLVIARHVDRDGAIVRHHIAACADKGRKNGKVKQVSVKCSLRDSVHGDTSVFVWWKIWLVPKLRLGNPFLEAGALERAKLNLSFFV